MKNFILNVAATVMAAAIVADVALLWNFNERLTRIETMLASGKTVTMKQTEIAKNEN